jgi:peptide/nickel transport system permease protein
LLRYIIKRILWLIPVIICVSFIVFALMDMAPGTIVDSMITETTTQEDIDELRAKYDLDKPMIYRYGKYMINLVQGNLGVSDVSDANVWNMYISRLPNTLLLSLASLVIGTSISIPLGIRAAKRAGKLTDNLTTTFTLFGMSMPSFWLGLLLLLLFSYQLKWLPAGGNKGILSFILPAVCSGLMLMATSARQTRSSMLDVLNSDYLRTARAKGVPEKEVIRKHALGNAWIPIITTIGGVLSISLAGSAVIESVFAWPGVGRLTVDAVTSRDVTMTCGCVIMTTILYVVLQLIVDLIYAFVDPRIKAQYQNTGKKRRRAA